MPTETNDRQKIRSLRRLTAELVDLAGAHAAATEAMLALALEGKPINPRTLERLIDELAALHLRAAAICGVDWPQILFRDGPLFAELTRRLERCPTNQHAGASWN